MLRFLLLLKTYRTFKSGLLLDFFVKKLFYKLSTYFFYTFTIFFGDKYILEHAFSNFSNLFKFLSVKLKTYSKNSFIKFFRLTILILFYISSIVFILYLI